MSDRRLNLPPLPPPPRGRPASFDWATAAEMLAAGLSSTEVAERMGCSRQTVWRALRRSRAMQDQVGEIVHRQRAEAGARLHALRAEIVRAIEMKVHQRDTRVILWLAGRLRLAETIYPATAPRDLVESPVAGASDATLPVRGSSLGT